MRYTNRHFTYLLTYYVIIRHIAKMEFIDENAKKKFAIVNHITH